MAVELSVRLSLKTLPSKMSETIWRVSLNKIDLTWTDLRNNIKYLWQATINWKLVLWGYSSYVDAIGFYRYLNTPSCKKQKPLKGHCKSIINGITGKYWAVAFIWMITPISHLISKVRKTLYSITNSTTGKYCSIAFIWMATLYDFTHSLKS